MCMLVDRNGLEILERDECLRLLAKVPIGRVALTVGALPTVLPVNFCVFDDQIVVRTAPGSKLDAALQNTVVAFEVDDFDSLYHRGWSVVVTGRTTAITDPEELSRLEVASVAAWV